MKLIHSLLVALLILAQITCSINGNTYLAPPIDTEYCERMLSADNHYIQTIITSLNRAHLVVPDVIARPIQRYRCGKLTLSDPIIERERRFFNALIEHVTTDEKLQSKLFSLNAAFLAMPEIKNWTTSEVVEVFLEIIRSFTGEAMEREVKAQVRAMVFSVWEDVIKLLEHAEDPFEASIRIGALGNSLDLGDVQLRNKILSDPDYLRALIEEEFNKKDFWKCNNISQMKKQLQGKKNKNILIFADNAGEDVLDFIEIKAFLREGHSVTIAGKSRATANDSTYEDLKQLMEDQRIKEFLGQDIKRVSVVPSGSITLGTDLARIAESPECCRAWLEADLIIFKGQANYYTVHDFYPQKTCLFLLKAKWPPEVNWQYKSGDYVAELYVYRSTKKAVPASSVKFDLPAVAAYIVDLFRADPERTALPSYLQIARCFKLADITIANHFPETIEEIIKCITASNIDSETAGRILTAIKKYHEKQKRKRPYGKFNLEAIVQYIIYQFDTDPSQKKLPNYAQLARQFNITIPPISTNFTEIIKEIKKHIQRNNINTETAGRIMKAIQLYQQKNRKRKLRSQFNLAKAVEAAIELFKDTGQMRFPTAAAIAAQCGVSRSPIDRHKKDIIKHVEEMIDKKEFDQEFKTRVANAIAMEKDLQKFIAQMIINLFIAKPDQFLIPSARSTAKKIGFSENALHQYWDASIQLVRQSIAQDAPDDFEKIDVQVKQRISLALEFYGDFAKGLSIYLYYLFQADPSRKQLPLIKEIAPVIGVDRSIISKNYKTAVDLLRTYIKKSQENRYWIKTSN
ncbi:MAG: ARMT1-like domain-containing protein [bacterium]